MNENVQHLVLLVLVIIAAAVWFVAFWMHLFLRPPRLDPDTGKPARVWKAWTGASLAISISNASGAVTVVQDDLGSLRSIVVRLIVIGAGIWVIEGQRDRIRILERERQGTIPPPRLLVPRDRRTRA